MSVRPLQNTEQPDTVLALYKTNKILKSIETLTGVIKTDLSAMKAKVDAIEGDTQSIQADTATIKAQANKLTFLGSNLRTLNQPYTYGIAEGDVLNHEKWKIIGYRSGVSTTESHLALGATGKFPIPTAAITIYFESSSANDTSAGTGARTILFTGINASGAVATETITLNGVTKVASVGTYLAPVINDSYVATAGTSLSNEGTITISNNAGATTATNIWATFTIGTNQCAGSIYYVPTGKKAFLLKFLGGESSVQGVIFRVYSKAPSALLRRMDIYQVDGNESRDEFMIPPTYAAGTYIEVTAQANSGTAVCSAKILGWIEDV